MSRTSYPMLAEGLERCSELSRDMRAAAADGLCRTSGEAVMLRRLADLIDHAVRLWAAGAETIRPYGLPIGACLVSRAAR